MTPATSVQGLLSRLEVLHTAHHPLGVSKRGSLELQAALARGANLAEGLERAGVRSPLARCLRLAQPADGVTVVDRLLPMLGEAHRQRIELRSSALYPLVVLICLISVAAVIRDVALKHVSVMAADLGGRLPEAGLTILLVAPIGLLVLLLASISLELPAIPFARVRLAIQRALMLEAVAVLAEDGVALPLAFRSVGVLAGAPLRAATAKVARALEAGVAPHATTLLDATAARLFHSAASRGAGPVVLHALAAQARVLARQRVGFEVLRVQTVMLLVAGVALALVGAGWFWMYTHLFVLG